MSQLPSGWQQLIDQRTGRVYYQDNVTKRTQWELPAAPSAAADALPAGWSSNVDPRTGKTYYSNHITKTTQWERPVALASAAEPPLPRGWVAMKDPRTGRTYYSSHILKKTQWDRPVTDVPDDFSRQPTQIRANSNSFSASAPSGPDPLSDLSRGMGAMSLNPGPSSPGRGLDPSKVVSKYDMYKQVLRAVLIDNQLNEAEEMMLSQLREQHSITYEEHEKMLVEVGVDPAKLKQLKQAGAGKQNASKECVVCLDSEADHVVLDCMHMCMCDSCAQAVLGEEDKRRTCPVCRGPVRTIKKVFV